MKQFRIATKTGIELVNGRKFSFYIDNVRYWFFYSNEIGHSLKISELESGFSVCDVSYTSRASSLGDDKLACKAELNSLVSRIGAAKVRSVIDNAPKLTARKADQ